MSQNSQMQKLLKYKKNDVKIKYPHRETHDLIITRLKYEPITDK